MLEGVTNYRNHKSDSTASLKDNRSNATEVLMLMGMILLLTADYSSCLPFRGCVWMKVPSRRVH